MHDENSSKTGILQCCYDERLITIIEAAGRDSSGNGIGGAAAHHLPSSSMGGAIRFWREMSHTAAAANVQMPPAVKSKSTRMYKEHEIYHKNTLL